MNSSFFVALAVLVAVAIAEDARSKKQAVYNPYGPIADANKYLATGVFNNHYFGYQLPQPYYQSAVYPSAAYQQYTGYQQQPYLQQYNQQYYYPYGVQYNNQLPYNYQHFYPNYLQGSSNNQLPAVAAAVIPQAPVYPSPGALPFYPPAAHPLYYGSSPYPPTTTTETVKPVTDPTKLY